MMLKDAQNGGEDIFPGCRKERVGGCAAEGAEGVDASTKYVPRRHKRGMLYGTVMSSVNSILALTYSCVSK
jgi:hypothetical protein